MQHKACSYQPWIFVCFFFFLSLPKMDLECNNDLSKIMGTWRAEQNHVFSTRTYPQTTYSMCQALRPHKDSGTQEQETCGLNQSFPVLWWNLVSTGIYKRLHRLLIRIVDLLSSKLPIICLENTSNEAHLCTTKQKHHSRPEHPIQLCSLSEVISNYHLLV